MANIYYSTDKVWWNTGNEIKPNREAFNRFVFTKATNFNVSWVDELTINVIVPNNNICTLIKIEDNIDNVTKYFYLLEVLNRTSANQECVYELDVWLTYLLPYLEANKTIKNFSTTRTLDATTLKPTINIEPIGVPTGNVISKQFRLATPNNPDADIYRSVGRETNFNDKVIPRPGVSTNIYYVFKSKDLAKDVNQSVYEAVIKDTGYTLANYVLVPILDIGALGVGATHSYKYMASTTSGVTTGTFNHNVLNSAYNLNELVRVVNDFGNNGLGEFIGVWVGPNFFRFKESGVKFPVVHHTNNISDFYIFNTTNIIFDPQRTNHKFNSYGTSGFGCFLALRLTSIPLELEPLLNSAQYNELLTGLKYQENTDNNIIANATKVSFNNSFSYSNGLQTTTTNIAMPVANDNYYNLLAAQRNTLNTSLGLSAMNSVLNGLGALTGLVPPAPSSTTSTYSQTRDYQAPRYVGERKKSKNTTIGPRGGVVTTGWTTTNNMIKPKLQKLKTSGTRTTTTTRNNSIGDNINAGLGVAKAGAQFISTLAEQNAYRQDLRTSTSSAVLNENDKYLNWYTIATKFNGLTKAECDNKNGTQIKSMMNVEFLSGGETVPGISYRFYGIESQPQVITISDNMDYYLLVTDNLALALQNEWGIDYTPTIKEAMLSLLTNGIRITGDVIR